MHNMFMCCLKLWVTEQITPRQHSEYARQRRKDAKKQALGRQVAAKSVKKAAPGTKTKPGRAKKGSREQAHEAMKTSTISQRS